MDIDIEKELEKLEEIFYIVPDAPDYNSHITKLESIIKQIVSAVDEVDGSNWQYLKTKIENIIKER